MININGIKDDLRLWKIKELMELFLGRKKPTWTY